MLGQEDRRDLLNMVHTQSILKGVVVMNVKRLTVSTKRKIILLRREEKDTLKTVNRSRKCSIVVSTLACHAKGGSSILLISATSAYGRGARQQPAKLHTSVQI